MIYNVIFLIPLCDSFPPPLLRCSLKEECEEQKPSIMMMMMLLLLLLLLALGVEGRLLLYGPPWPSDWLTTRVHLMWQIFIQFDALVKINVTRNGAKPIFWRFCSLERGSFILWCLTHSDKHSLYNLRQICTFKWTLVLWHLKGNVSTYSLIRSHLPPHQKPSRPPVLFRPRWYHKELYCAPHVRRATPLSGPLQTWAVGRSWSVWIGGVVAGERVSS